MSHRIEIVSTKRHGPALESTMRVVNKVENRDIRISTGQVLTGKQKRLAGVLGGVLALLLPGLAFAAAPYAVERQSGVELQLLPIDPDAPVHKPRFEGPGQDGPVEVPFYGSYGIDFPFPVTFFGQTYSAGAVGEGILTFGPRSETLCAVQQPAVRPACANGNHTPAGPIPREIFPNRLLAVWWKGGCSQVSTQGWGEAPNRTFVVELAGCGAGYSINNFDSQVWFREGSSAIEVIYGGLRNATATYGVHGQVGLMSPVPGGGVEGYPGLPCSMPASSCGWQDFPENSKLIYSIPADLRVDSVEAPATGLPGLPLQLRARIKNIGDATAVGTTVRFHLSERPSIGAGTRVLGDVEGTFDLAKGEELELDFEAILPADLVAGSYYVIAQADPFGAVPRDLNQANNVRASQVVLVGVKAPALFATSIEAPAAAVYGAPFSVSWRVENQGSATAHQVPFGVYLSDDEEITLLDRRLGLGEFTVGAFDEDEGTLEIAISEEIAPGLYHLGLILDPDDILPTAFKYKRIASSDPISVDGGELRVLTGFLPDAELGKTYCLKLEAAGGNGTYEWAARAGSTLPPGLVFEELPAGAKEAGAVYSTRICGKPSAVGSFTFGVEVRSAEMVAEKSLELSVQRDALPLEIATFELPFATYMDRYEVALRGRGGSAPYRWSIVGGALPSGISLRSDGILLGAPATDGRFSFDVLLTDAAGNRSTRTLALLVTSPNRLSCGTRSLPTRGIGMPYDLDLNAAGGIKPLRWRSVETRRLSSNVGERSETLGSEPPPGIVLGSLGQVSGSPTEMGRYLWTVQVSDSAPMPVEDHCFIVVDVPSDRGLSVSTRGFAVAVAGAFYTTNLQAAGGEGSLHWSILEGGKLPDGLSLSTDGRIEGTPAVEQLGGEGSRIFPFLVEVRDARNRRGVAPLSITVIDGELQVIAPPDEAPQILKTSGGCSSGAGGLGLWMMVAVGGWVLLRKRNRKHQGF